MPDLLSGRDQSSNRGSSSVQFNELSGVRNKPVLPPEEKMRPFKRLGKTLARTSVAFDPLPQALGSQLPQTLGSQNQEDVYVQRVQQQPRVHNWTESMDTIFLSLLTEEHTLGNFVNGSFTSVAWVRICHAFNARTNLQLSKDQIKNRLKVLKRTFALYNNLANRSGWGWDYNNNIPTPDDPSVWAEVIADNPSYAKCRDRPFPAFKDMAFLTEKTTVTGRYAGSSRMAAAQTVESSSSSSPGEDENDLGVRLSGFNISQSTWNAGSSEAPQYAHVRMPGAPDTPSPTTDIPNVGGSASGSGHSSGSKRPRSPQQTYPQPIPTSSSGGRRRRTDVGHNAIEELVDIGQKKLDLAREIYEHEKEKESRIPTISACMTRVKQMPGITPAKVLVAGQALKDPSDRELFMSFDDEIAIMWLDEQVAMKQNVYYRQYHPVS